MQFRSLGVAIVICLLVAGAAAAKTMHFAAALKGADEVPPNTTAGTGKVKATLDTATKAFSYTITYSGLTGPAMAGFRAGGGANRSARR